MVWPEAGAREKPGGWRLPGNEWIRCGILSASSPRADPGVTVDRARLGRAGVQGRRNARGKPCY